MDTAVAIDQAWIALEPAELVAFTTLTLALIALWLPGRFGKMVSLPWWSIAFAVSLVAAATAHVVHLVGFTVVLGFGLACVIAHRGQGRVLTVVAHTIVLLLCAGLLLHVLPGFDNPRVLNASRLTPDAEPYTKYLSFDKGIAGLFLLGLYVPSRTSRDPIRQRWRNLPWQFALLVAVVLVLTLALGYARWAPKFPAWWTQWVWSMVFLTALPEEAVFRGVVQEWLAGLLRGPRRAGPVPAVIAGALFGIAHVAGGPGYVVLATVAGIGYGWIYASTGSIAAAIAAHAGLNTLHYLLFTYPALATAAH
jgi:membrane protease YdiL (CAAX protease family)